MQPTSGFAYDEAAYVKALDAFVDAVGLAGQPINVLTHGFVLGQYGLLWALEHADTIEKFFVMNVPLGKKAQLRPELSKYKAAMPFMRPKAGAKFAGDLYNASGLAYVIQYDDAQARAGQSWGCSVKPCAEHMLRFLTRVDDKLRAAVGMVCALVRCYTLNLRSTCTGV